MRHLVEDFEEGLGPGSVAVVAGEDGAGDEAGEEEAGVVVDHAGAKREIRNGYQSRSSED